MTNTASISQIQCGLCTDIIEYDLEPQLVDEVYWLDCNHMCHMDCVGLDEIHNPVYCYLCARERRIVAKTFRRIPFILTFLKDINYMAPFPSLSPSPSPLPPPPPSPMVVDLISDGNDDSDDDSGDNDDSDGSDDSSMFTIYI